MHNDAESGIGARLAATPGRLDRGVVTVATFSSAVFFVMLAGAGILGPDPGQLDRALGPAVVACAGAIQLLRRRPRPLAHIAIGAATLAYDVWRFGPDGSAVMGLTAMAMVGVLFVRRRVWLYVAGATVTLMAASILWVPPDRPPLERLAAGSGLTVLFVFTSSLVHWMRAELEAGRARYRNLFYRARVPIWEIDYSAVGRWLDERREEGVTDLRAFMRQHPEAVAQVAALVHVLDVNAAAMEFVGATRRDQITGPVLKSRLQAGLGEALLAQLAALWDGEPMAAADLSIRRSDGTTVYGEMSSTVRERDGKLELSNVVTTVTDVTERKRHQQRLEELMRSKDDFVASISHEVRTPLTAVVGLADELANRYDDFERPEVREMVSTISDQSLEVAYIVEDLLVAARQHGGTLLLDCAAIDLQREVLGVMATCSQGVEVVADVRDVAPLTWADPARVRQILRNLLVNADRHGGGATRVHLRYEDGQSVVEVRDAGPPIPAAERDTIFDRYYTARRSAGLTASVGLGLTVSRELARMMGGDVTYAHDGRESVFSLVLPSADTDGARPSAEAKVAAGV